MKRREDIAETTIIHQEAIELMAVNGQMTHTVESPFVLLVDLDPDQVRHNFRKTVVMIAFHPYNFHSAFRIGKLSDVAEKLPVLFLQPAEIEVTKDVTEQNEAAKRDFLQHPESRLGAANFRPQMEV